MKPRWLADDLLLPPGEADLGDPAALAAAVRLFLAETVPEWTPVETLVIGPPPPPDAPEAQPLLLDMAMAIGPIAVPLPGDEADAKGGGKPGGGSGGTGGGGGGTSVLSSYTSGSNSVADSEEYNIQIQFKGSLWTVELQKAFVDAANFLSAVIIGDVQDITVVGGGPKSPVDDIRITAELTNIDGDGGILGQAGPTALRSVSYLPAAATMQFDLADADWMYSSSSALGGTTSSNYWYDVVLHEMMHCLGFGTIWDQLGLVEISADGTSASFTGANANAFYVRDYSGSGGVPVETDGGSGTALGHWDEETFTTELMTGYLEPDTTQDLLTGEITVNSYEPRPISAMSLASLYDLGYEIAPGYVLV